MTTFPQDKLMSYVGRVIRDPDTEILIRKYLRSGVMENGMYLELQSQARLKGETCLPC